MISTEILWFLKGTVPEAAWEWLSDTTHRLIEEDYREDYYLGALGWEEIRIKFRERRLEIKSLVQQLVNLALAPSCRGVAKRWTKCNLERVDPADVLARMTREAAWVRAWKHRMQCRFNADGQATPWHEA